MINVRLCDFTWPTPESSFDGSCFYIFGLLVRGERFHWLKKISNTC